MSDPTHPGQPPADEVARALEAVRQGRGLEGLGGSRSPEFNAVLLLQTTDALWEARLPGALKAVQDEAAMAALEGIGPKDELEGMLAAQMVATHAAAMEAYRRAMLPNQNADARQRNLAQAGKLSRTFAQLLDALNKHRGKGQQKVTVEHVHVHPGGQAVVGTVQSRRGGRAKHLED